jgi:hypothetical protein
MFETLTTEPCTIDGNRTYVTHEVVTVDGENYLVCDSCLDAHRGPGKFEGETQDDETLALALVLHALTLDGLTDAWLSDESGSVSRIGKYLLVEDGRGFVEVRTFADADAAQRELNGYEDDGLGASEDDAWISYSHGGIEVSFAGKYIGRFERLTRAQAAVSLEMRKSGYFPNVWLAGEHGPTVRRIDVW